MGQGSACRARALVSRDSSLRGENRGDPVYELQRLRFFVFFFVRLKSRKADERKERVRRLHEGIKKSLKKCDEGCRLFRKTPRKHFRFFVKTAVFIYIYIFIPHFRQKLLNLEKIFDIFPESGVSY